METLPLTKTQEYNKKYYISNREKLIEKKKKWYAANIEKAKEKNKKWRESNPEKVKERVKKWKELNPEKVKKWNEANPEHYKKWKEANPEKVREYARKNNKIQTENITDNYVKKRIMVQFSDFEISRKDITPEMILLKKVEIKCKRFIKKQNNTTL